MILQILNDSAISANWVLVGVTTIASMLLFAQLKEIKSTLKDLIEVTRVHAIDIAVIKKHLEFDDKEKEKA